MHPLPPSTVLQSRYRIRGSRGRGGQGRVYVAESLQLGRQVAVKEMLEPEGTEDRDALTSAFQAEARLLAGLDHPGLPRVYDFFHENGRFYLIMEFIDGDTLEEVAAACGGRVSPHLVQSWMADILDVLEYLHARRPAIIYRDLKPDNVLRAADGRIRLVDFGIARLMRQGTRTNRLLANMGSPGFAAPEQYAGTSTDPRTDLYGLGATAWRLLAGEAPPPAPSRAAGVAMLRLRDVGVAPGLEHALDRLMRLNPAERPAGVAGARLLLARAGETRPTAAPPRAAENPPPGDGHPGNMRAPDEASARGSRAPREAPTRTSPASGEASSRTGAASRETPPRHCATSSDASSRGRPGVPPRSSPWERRTSPTAAPLPEGCSLEEPPPAEGWPGGLSSSGSARLRGYPGRRGWKMLLAGCLLVALLTLVLGMATEARPVMLALSYLDGLAGTADVPPASVTVPTPLAEASGLQDPPRHKEADRPRRAPEAPVEAPRSRIAEATSDRPSTAVPRQPRPLETGEPKPRQSPPERGDRYVDAALAPTVDGEQPQEILARQAREAAAAGQHERAVELFRAALRVVADDPSLWDDLGLSLDWLERRNESVAAYETALRLQPDSPTFMAHLGSAWARQGEVSKGLVLCERAARMAPRNAAVLNDLALACIAAGDRGTAIRAYRRALDVTPTDGVVWGNLGHLYYEMKDRDRARDCYRAALTLAPNQPLVRERASQVR